MHRLLLLLGLSILLSSTASAVPEASVEKPTLEADQFATLFSDIESKLQTDPAGAANELMAFIDDATQPETHGAAYGLLGKAFHKMGLNYSAIVTYNQGFELDMAINTKLAVPAIELAQMNDRSALLGKVFFENYGDLQSADARKAVAYEAAKFAQQNGDFALAGAMLSIVPDTAPNYAQIKNLEGTIMSLQGNAAGAIVSFLIAEQIAIQGQDSSLTNTVRINLARAYFAAGNFPRSIDYYRLIERNSNIWADAHFEQAWAYFRMNDMNSTLSMLQTHTSPFFDEFYYPEAELLRIYALFVMCKFPSAAKETDHFIGLNTPKRDVLDAFTQQSAESIFEQVRSDVEKDTTQIPFLVRSRFLNDASLTNAVSAIQHAEKELVKLERMPQGSSIQTARTLIEADMERLRTEVGSRVLNRAQFMAAQLQEMLTDADMHKLDILEMEAQMLRQASVTGKMEEAKRVIQRDKRLLNNERTWPYQGEYWADEIGYYRIKSKPECPNSMFR